MVASSMLQILGYMGAGWLARELFGGKKTEDKPAADAPALQRAEPPPQRFGMKAAAAEGLPAAPPGPRAPLDPNMPLDPGIDEELERSVLNALQSADRRAVLGFADSMGNPQGAYGYFPIAASVLRYHAAALQRAEAIRAKQAAPAPAPAVAGPSKASALPAAAPAARAPNVDGGTIGAPRMKRARAPSPVASGTTRSSAETHEAAATQGALKLNGHTNGKPAVAPVAPAPGDATEGRA